MTSDILGAKIGKTLFAVAKEKNVLSLVAEDLKEASKAILEEKSFLTLMNNPKIVKEKKFQIVDNVFKDANEYVVNVIKILVNNSQLSLIAKVSEVFQTLNDNLNKKKVVKVESVYELNSEELGKLEEAIKNKLNLDSVEFVNVVDKTLLGGLRISYDGKVMDSSIKSRVEAIRKKLLSI